MDTRTCFVWVWISNESGKAARYGLSPLPAAERALSVAAVRLVNFSESPSPVYTVRLALDGQTSCSCWQHARSSKCKHAAALVAAGLLPAALVAVLQERTLLLNRAEAECRRLAAAGAEEKTIRELNAQGAAERIADLEADHQRHAASVSNLNARTALLQQQLDEAQDMIQQPEHNAPAPKRRRPIKKAA